MDLRASYLGFELRTPLVASPSPLTGSVAELRRLEEAGAGAVVLSSLFEEEILLEGPELEDTIEAWKESFGEAPSHFRELEEHRTRPEQALELVAAAKRALHIPVIASLNVHAPGPWVDHVELIEEAGADALELTVFDVAADPEVSGQDLEARCLEVVRAVRSRLQIPLAVKIAPFFTALAHTARAIVQAGADGLVLFHRGYVPYLDLRTLEVGSLLPLSTSQQVFLPLRWIALLRDRTEVSLGAAGGVHSAHDAIRLLMAGANAVMMSSALVEEGPQHLKTVEKGLVDWMSEAGYESVRQLTGSASRECVTDPAAYERVSYVKTLRSFFRSLES
jgi:dihydroorotate dehydrogenase (fumarate)